MDLKESLKISIIMPAYNVEKYIIEAVDSILRQTYSNFELLICDDGSNDSTWSLIQKFSDSRIKKFRNKENIGNLLTSNFLFKHCQGDIITIQDADDFSEDNRLELAVLYLLNNPKVGVLGTNYIKVNSIGELISCGFLPEENDIIKDLMLKEVPPLLFASSFVRKSIADKVGFFRLFFDRKGYADMDWLSRCIENTSVANLKTPLYYYRQHEDSFNSFYANKKKNEIEQNMHYLIVLSHLKRLNNEVDFFEGHGDLKLIKKELSKLYFTKSESNCWDKDWKLFFENIKISLKFNYKNINVYKLFIYGLKQFLYEKITI